AITPPVYSAEKDRNLLVGAYCRGRLMDHQPITAKKGQATNVTLHPASPAGGVYRVTVFEEQDGDAHRRQLVPRAERLIYHSPGEKLSLQVTPDHKQYTPGEKVKLAFKAVDQNEQAAPAARMGGCEERGGTALAG